MRTVAFAGLIGAGKDTAAKALIEAGYVKVSFADAVKDCVATVFNLPRDLLEGDTEKSREWRNERLPFWDNGLDLEQYVTPRYLLQFVATDVFRTSMPDIWVLAAQSRISDLHRAGKNVVITDLRFLNEARMLKKIGAQVFGIYRTMPNWVEPFYQYMDRLYPEGIQEGSTWDEKNMLDIASKCDALKKHRVHISEWQPLLIRDFDGMIQNRGSVEELHNKVRALVGVLS